MKFPIEHDPRPKPVPENVSSVSWPVRRTLRCPPVIPPPPALFADVIEDRRSSRAIAPAPLREIVNAVAYATRPRFVLAHDELGRTRRPSPSAGALHPIEIAIVAGRRIPRAFHYRAVEHELDLLVPTASGKLLELLRAAREIVPSTDGTTIVLLGDAERVAAVYRNATSLLWRDSGALLQTLFFSATAFRLAFCPLGILGYQLTESLALEDRLIAAGVAVIGRKADETKHRGDH